jgi:hypothetical protein
MRRLLLAGLMVVTGWGVALGQTRSEPARNSPGSAGKDDAAGGLPAPLAPTSPAPCVPESFEWPGARDGSDGGPATRFWVEADYLLWQVKGDALPPW